jgi:hypothetical protein
VSGIERLADLPRGGDSASSSRIGHWAIRSARVEGGALHQLHNERPVFDTVDRRGIRVVQQ